MASRALTERTEAILDASGVRRGALAHEPSGMHLLRHDAPTGLDATVYRPLLCLVLQGAKEVGTSARSLTVASGRSLIVSHALPVVSRIVEASAEAPYVALVLPVDPDLLRSLAPAMRPHARRGSPDRFSIHLCDTDAGMEDALLRYLSQCDAEEERGLLAPITLREIHARLLIGGHAETLLDLLWHESTSSRIFRPTQEIRSELARPVVVGDLAARVGMSSSAFFEKFKAVTGTSPLQYQKDLRLLRAREGLRATGAKVSEVAFGVGYESSAQFSREYSRKFGRSPRQDRGTAPPG